MNIHEKVEAFCNELCKRSRITLVSDDIVAHMAGDTRPQPTVSSGHREGEPKTIDDKAYALVVDYFNKSNGEVFYEELAEYLKSVLTEEELIQWENEEVLKAALKMPETEETRIERLIDEWQDSIRELTDFEEIIESFEKHSTAGGWTREHLIAYSKKTHEERLRVDREHEELSRQFDEILAGMRATNSKTVGEWQEKVKKTYALYDSGELSLFDVKEVLK